jgi:hypothetical protein
MQWIAYSLAASLALVADAAVAENNEGFYFGAGRGDYSADIDNIDSIGDVDLDFDGSATKLFGGWRANRFVALQVDYSDFADATTPFGPGNARQSTSGLAPTIVGTLPLGPVELFAKGGIIFYDVKLSTVSGDLLDSTGHDPVYGVGIGLTVFERIALRAEYERIDISEYEKPDAVWLTAAWRF